MTYPLWLEVFLAICMGLAIAGLGAFLLYTCSIRLIKAALRLEDKRTNRETDALNNWKTAYEAERQERLEVVSDLVNDNINLRKHNEEMEKLLALVPVSVLKKIREEAKLA